MTSAPGKILLIENDAEHRRALKKALTASECVIAETPARATDALKNDKFTMILGRYEMIGDSASRIAKAKGKAIFVIITGGGSEEAAAGDILNAADLTIRDDKTSRRHILKALTADASAKTTGHKQLEQSYIQNKQLLTAIPLILIGIGADFRITHWNQAAEKSFAIKAENVMGKAFFDCGIEWNWSRIAALISDHYRAVNIAQTRDVRYRMPDGKAGCLHVSLTGFGSQPDEKSTEQGLLLLAEDVTETQTLQSQLSEAQKLRSMGQLVGGIAHEVNLPAQQVSHNIRFVQSCFDKISSMLAEYDNKLRSATNRAAKGKETEHIEKIREVACSEEINFLRDQTAAAIDESLQSIEQVVDIVQEMKQFAYPGTGKAELVNINRVIEGVILVSRNHWKDITEIRTEFDTSLPYIRCQPEAVNHVILNVLVNAAEAIARIQARQTDYRGIITVKTCRSGEKWLQVHVHDNGQPVPEEIADKIFEPFFTTKELGQGTGQGLAITKTLMEKANGLVTFESSSAKGTVFTLHFSIDQPTQTQPQGAHKKTHNAVSP